MNARFILSLNDTPTIRALHASRRITRPEATDSAAQAPKHRRLKRQELIIEGP